MQCSRSFLFQMCLSLVVSTGSCSCKPLSNVIQSEEPDRYYSQLSEQDLLEEENTDSRLENLLGNMKEGFLRQLNMSDVPQEQSKIFPPQFMVELYNKYASNATAVPESDVIRSFTIQDVSHSVRNGTKSKHRLLFNVSVPHHEEVTIAELRLFTRVDQWSRSRVNCHGVKATIKVYEVDYKESEPITHLLDGKEVIGLNNSWEAFDVTDAIQRQIKVSGHGASEFEVVVDSKHCAPFKSGSEGGGCLDVSVSTEDNTSAALIVFSDDLGSRKREAKKELKEMLLHEEETLFSSGPDWHGGYQVPNEIPGDSHPRRKRRQADSNYCRKTSLKVNFRDIGWDKWIVAPPEYDAFECRGLCYHPLTDEMTPSKHALIQTLVNLRNPKKANMACCVPIKLDPITVMYRENGQITIRHVYEEMKVAECGCR